MDPGKVFTIRPIEMDTTAIQVHHRTAQQTIRINRRTVIDMSVRMRRTIMALPLLD